VRYDAFISYSHAADGALAPAVQRALQTLARPWNRRRALEVFRDQTGLAVSPGLWSSIVAGLDESEYFVLLASPGAADSPWVNQEVEHWAASKSIDHLLPVLTAGEWVWDPTRGDFDWDLSTAVPPALRGKFREEPRHLDLRWAREETDLDLRHSRFREAVAQLAAPMHGMTPQDLESSDVTRFRHVVRLRRAVVAVLCVLLLLVSGAGVLAVHNAHEAQLGRQAAKQQQAIAESQAIRALSLQLLAQAKVAGSRHRTLSLLLTAAAARFAPSLAWSSLVSELDQTAGLRKVFDLPGQRHASPGNAVDVERGIYASIAHDGKLQPSIRLWDLNTDGRIGPGGPASHDVLPLQDQRFYGFTLTDLSFGPSGALAAVYHCTTGLCATAQPREGSDAGRAHGALGGIDIVNVSTGKATLLPQSAGAQHLTFDHAGNRLAATVRDHIVRIWTLSNNRLQATLHPEGTPTALAFSANDRHLAVGQRAPSRIAVWTVGRGERSHVVGIAVPRRAAPRQLVFGSDVIASRNDAGSVRLWRPGNDHPLGVLAGAGSVESLALSRHGTLATADTRGLLHLWSVESLKQTAAPRHGGPRGTGIQLSFDRSADLVSVGSDIRVWDTGHWGDLGRELYHHRSAVTSIAVSADGVMASGDAKGVVRFWNAASSRPLGRALAIPGGSVTALAFGPRDILAVGDADGTVHLFDASKRLRVRGPVSAHDGKVSSLAFSPDGTKMAAGYSPRPHEAWHRRAPIHVWTLHPGPRDMPLAAGQVGGAASVAFGAGGMFASAGADFLAVWNEKTWLSRVLGDNTGGPYTAVALTADGQTLASSAARFNAGGQRPVALWSKLGDDPQEVLMDAGSAAHADAFFRSLAFSPDGHLLAGAGDGGVQLWDVSQDLRLGGRLGPSASTVAVSPDGSQVFAGEMNGMVQSYPATADGWLKSLCSVVSRNLTTSEWNTYVGAGTPYQRQCLQYGAR
jgi:WD40 repeat protein